MNPASAVPKIYRLGRLELGRDEDTEFRVIQHPRSIRIVLILIHMSKCIQHPLLVCITYMSISCHVAKEVYVNICRDDKIW